MEPDPKFRFAPLVKIASGGSATVYVGTRSDGRSGELVALKRPHPHVLDDERQRAALLREARVASALRHPNVVEVREIESSGGEFQLVMDYVEGATLGTLIVVAAKADARMPEDIVLRIVIDACAGLDAVHEERDADGRPLGLVHRDVSPQNILVGVDGRARLTDFGLVKGVSEGVPSTTQGTLKGKLGYMAPEYVSYGRSDRAVDVFAMGVLLWEALAGKRLFRGDNEVQTLDRVLRDNPSPLADIAARFAPLDAIVAHATAKDPSARIASARSLGSALEAAPLAIATHAEVGAYVARVAAEELAERRLRIHVAERERARGRWRARRGAIFAVAVLLFGMAGSAAFVRSRVVTPAIPAIAVASASPAASAPLPTREIELVEVTAPASSTASASPSSASVRPRPSAPPTPPARVAPPNPYVRTPPPR